MRAAAKLKTEWLPTLSVNIGLANKAYEVVYNRVYYMK